MANSSIPPEDPRLQHANTPHDYVDDEFDEEEEEDIEDGHWARELWVMIPSWMTSALVMLSLLLILAALTIPIPGMEGLQQLIAAPGEEEQFEELETFEDDSPIEINVDADVAFDASDFQAEDLQFSAFDEPAAMASMDLSETSLDSINAADLAVSTSSIGGDALSGRGSGKGTLVAQGGGSEGSEIAVARALRWLAAHQCPDGGWNFDLKKCPTCRGACSGSGATSEARIAATSLALLPFLGAGQTHRTGNYREVVQRGLYFLKSQMKRTPQGGSFHEGGGRMYSHGLASIVMCEAYAMTRDRTLYGPAQEALNYICYAQDPVGGGWRYTARTAGDTSVVGWQLMALKSGNMAYLSIPAPTLVGAKRFLDSVESGGGARYGYTGPINGSGHEACTPIGLLCRMYMGTPHDDPGLKKGIDWLSKRGPDKANSYYNYYGTQVMRHYGGDEWDKWNGVMRDQLVNSQASKGHEMGSWHFSGEKHGDRGGRLYTTAMCTMILEVYYRHLPIYRTQSTDDEFPID